MSKGRFVAPDAIVNTNINKFKDRLDNNQYDNMIQGTPTKVVYYNVNKKSSSVDDGLLDIEQYIGPNSPIRWNKIHDAVLYFDSKLDLTLEEDVGGIKSDMTGGATIASGTIKPYPLDFFIVEYLGESYLFKVTNVNIDTIRSRPQYRIEWEIGKLGSLDEAEKQVDGSYKMIFENIGTKDNCIISNERWCELEKLRDIRDCLVEDYIDTFYEDETNSIIYNYVESHVYSPDLTKFLINTKVLRDDDNLQSIILDILIDPYKSLNVDYRSGIFKAIEEQNTSKLNVNKYRMLMNPVEKNHHCVLGQYKRTYTVAYNLAINEEEVQIAEDWFSKETLESIKANTLDELTGYDQVIGRHVNKIYMDGSDLEILNNITISNTIEDYCKIPMLLHILNQNIKVLLTNEEARLKT
ncbi:MAG: hypothetical protein ACRC0G_07760 [Fusobacteriaceae bacterium]